MPFASIDELESALAGASYLPDRGLSTALYLSLKLEKPLLLEGEAGVGKTEAAKAIAQALGARLIRRPLLEAIESEEPVVLLIDEIDRADEEFEAFLLEVLSDYQITIPELGTIRARRRPPVVLTSNRTRELHDALKRRCLYHWIPFPDAARERLILRAYAPGLDQAAADALVNAITRVRGEKLLKRPGIAETIDWAQGASVLATEGTPWPEALKRSLGLLLKEQEDVERAEAVLEAVR